MLQQPMTASRYKYPLWDFKNVVASVHNELYGLLAAKVSFIKAYYIYRHHSVFSNVVAFGHNELRHPPAVNSLSVTY